MEARQEAWLWDADEAAETHPAWMPTRVMAGNTAPVPLTLVHPAFCAFVDALAEVPPPRTVDVANGLVDTVDGYFNVKGDWTERTINRDFIFLLQQLPFITALEGDVIASDGTVYTCFHLPALLVAANLHHDPSASNDVAYYTRVMGAKDAVRVVDGRLHMREELLAALPSVPCFQLNIHHGSVLEVRGVALAAPGLVSEALAAAPLRGIRGGTGVDALARVLHACVAGVTALPTANDGIGHQPRPTFTPMPPPSLEALIYPLEFEDGRRFKCIRSLNPGTARLAFEAVELPAGGAAVAAAAVAIAAGSGAAGAPRFVIKLARGRYGADIHRRAAAAGYAPKIYNIKQLRSDVCAVVMDLLDTEGGGWERYNAETAPVATKAEVTRAYLAAFTHDGNTYVHGDLRYGNVFIRTDVATGHVGVMFIDFDWAGRAGEVVYPSTMNYELWQEAKVDGASPGYYITRDHDLRWLDRSHVITTIACHPTWLL